MNKKKILIAIVLTVLFATRLYSDIFETSAKSYLLLDSIFSGNFPVGYSFESAFYIPVHFTFAIWNIPFWILYRFGIGTPDATVNILWAKLLVVLCLFGIVVAFRKILDEAEFKGNKDFWSLMLITSLLVFPPIFDESQYDTIGFFFGIWGTLLAIRCENDKLSWKALLLLSFASSFKLLFLFAALCIIFVKNNTLKRNITDTLASLGGSVFFVALSKIFTSVKGQPSDVLMSDVAGSIKITDNSAEISVGFVERLFKSTIPGGMFDTSICFLLMFAVFFALFLFKRAKTKKEQVYTIAFSCTAVYLILMTFALAHPQWSIFPGIFLILLLALSEDKYKKRNLIINEIFEISLLLQQFGYYYWVYLNEKGFDYTFLKNINNHFFSKNLKSPGDILVIGDNESLMMVISALTVISIIVLLVYNNPWKKPEIETGEINNDVLENKTLNFRNFVLVAYLICAFLIRLVF